MADMNWADELDDSAYEPLPVKEVAAPAAPAAPKYKEERRPRPRNDEPRARRTHDDDLPVPEIAPFVAYIGNVAFDATEEEALKFFGNGNCKVTAVNFVRDREIPNRNAGFGYVEFATREDLVRALEADGAKFCERAIKVNVALARFAPSQRKRQGHTEKASPLTEADMVSDWRRGEALPPKPAGERSPYKKADDQSRPRDAQRDGQRDAPQQRKKLTLQPRSLPVEGDIKPVTPKKEEVKAKDNGDFKPSPSRPSPAKPKQETPAATTPKKTQNRFACLALDDDEDDE